MIIYALGKKYNQANKAKVWNAMKVFEALPVRLEALHLCHDYPVRRIFIAVVKAALGPFMNIRARTHYGKIILHRWELLHS